MQKSNIKPLIPYNNLSILASENGGPQSFVDNIFDSGYLSGTLDSIDHYQPQIDALKQKNAALLSQNSHLSKVNKVQKYAIIGLATSLVITGGALLLNIYKDKKKDKLKLQ